MDYERGAMPVLDGHFLYGFFLLKLQKVIHKENKVSSERNLKCITSYLKASASVLQNNLEKHQSPQSAKKLINSRCSIGTQKITWDSNTIKFWPLFQPNTPQNCHHCIYPRQLLLPRPTKLNIESVTALEYSKSTPKSPVCTP